MDVTVLLCVYNGHDFIREAIESVLNQSYQDYEFLIVDDGSLDDTVQIVRSYKDYRIKLIESHHDYIHSLNTGIHEAKGKFIARIDADDIMHRHRIMKQYQLMRHYPFVHLCTSWVRFFNLHKSMRFAPCNGFIHNPMSKLIRGNYIVHSSVMLRKGFLIDNNLSYDNIPFAEDYKLWFDMLKNNANFYMIPQELTYYRKSRAQVSSKYKEVQMKSAIKIKGEIKKYIQDNGSKCQNGS